MDYGLCGALYISHVYFKGAAVNNKQVLKILEATIEDISRECDRLTQQLARAREALEDIENDDGRIPKEIWALRNAVLAEPIKGEGE